MNYIEYLDRMTFNENGKKLFCDIHEAVADIMPDAQAAYNTDDESFGMYIKHLSEAKGILPEQLTFYIYVRLSENTLDNYKKLGIPDDVFFATMSDFARNCERTFELYGTYGIQQQVYRKWFRLNLDMCLFRLGRLQFDIRKSLDDIPEFDLKIGDTVLWVHIPKGDGLSDAECESAYDYARVFFKKHFDLDKCVFMCNSWLLHPWLREVLSKESGIIKFQSKFKLTKIATDYDNARAWIFPGLENVDLEKLPQKTSLQRAAVIRMKNNEDIGYAIGIRK